MRNSLKAFGNSIAFVFAHQTAMQSSGFEPLHIDDIVASQYIVEIFDLLNLIIPQYFEIYLYINLNQLLSPWTVSLIKGTVARD